ncbi:hypothetical protein LL947_06615 [Halomonas sp. BLK-85]
MPKSDNKHVTPKRLTDLTSNLGGQLQRLERSLLDVKDKEKNAGDLVVEVGDIRKEILELERSSHENPDLQKKLKPLTQRIDELEKHARNVAQVGEFNLENHQSILKEIRDSIAEVPELADQVGISTTPLPRAPAHLRTLIESPETQLRSVLSSQKNVTMTAATLGNRPIDVSESAGGFQVKERPHLAKIRVKATLKENGGSGSHLPLEVVGFTKDGKRTVISRGVTNNNGYLSLDTSRTDLSGYESIELNTRHGATQGIRFDKDEFLDVVFENPIIFDIPTSIARKIAEKPKDFIFTEDPDADDLMNDPESFSFDAHEHDGSACLKARSEIAVREFHFSQLMRGEESDLIAQNEEDAYIWERDPVTSPVPVRPNNNLGANLSVVGGRIITGKIVNYRQAWQPAAQGLGKLLYSLALAPREEIKLAIIDWRRSERAMRQDSVKASEALEADMQRDTTVSDIVTGSIEENISGGSRAEASAEANNQPGWKEYLGGAVIGGLIGGPVGAGLGIAAAHLVRPDTGSESDGNIDAWNNAVRNISSQAVRQASDVVSQRASSIRDLRSTVVTASEVTEREEVRTRTVRNQNQHHALTIQYYQVLAHYRVVTEAMSEEDVLMVPYAIDHDIFAPLPPLPDIRHYYTSYNWALVHFLLRHQSALRQALPRHLTSAMDALERLFHNAASYQEPEVTASRWTIMADESIEEGIDLFLNTEYGRVPLRPLDSSRTQFVSTPVALHRIRGLHFRLDPKVQAEINMPDLPGFIPQGAQDVWEDILRERMNRALEFSFSNLEVTAHLQRGRHLKPHISVYTLPGTGNVTVSTEQRSATLGLEVPSQGDLRNNLLQTTPREADYQLLQSAVRWLQQNPMTAMSAIWMSEDPQERALRFDRLSYNGKSLLNLIVNVPIGVDGNYVAFRLAPNLRVLPPIDLSRISRQARVVSVPTSGVFAETYLSCHNATEKRDVTREIDQSKAVPFGATDIAPVATGGRSPMQAPQPTSLPSAVLGYQSPPQTPNTAIDSALQGLTTSSPFHNLSYGEETMNTIRTLADTAMKVDGEKQKQILDTITELAKVAADTALAAAQASMGIPPTGGSLSGGESGGASGGSGSSNGTPLSGGAGSAGSSAALQPLGVTPQQRAQVGQSVRQSDPATNHDHARVIEEAVKSGQLSAEQGRIATENLLGATGNSQALTKKNQPPGKEADPQNGPIKRSHLVAVWPNSTASADDMDAIASELSANLMLGDLNTELRLAHFMAQVRHETGYRLSLVESLNYSVEALKTGDFKFYRDNPALAEQHGRNDETDQPADREAIANHAYARASLGNGGPETGDGWRFRGRGLIQLTGRSNYAAFTARHTDLWGEVIDFESEPDLVAEPRYAVRSAIDFWLRHGMNDVADGGDSREVCDQITNLINSGTSDESREARYSLFLELMNQRLFSDIV